LLSTRRRAIAQREFSLQEAYTLTNASRRHNLFGNLTASFTAVPLNTFIRRTRLYNAATSMTVYDSLGNAHVCRCTT